MPRGLTIDDLVYRLGFENEDEFLRELDKVFKHGTRTAEQAGEEAGAAYKEGLTGSLKRINVAAIVGGAVGGAVAAISNKALEAAQEFITDSVEAFTHYERSLSKLRASGVKNLRELDEKMSMLASTTRVFSRIDIAQAVSKIVEAGYKERDALQIVGEAANAAASQIDPLTGSFADLGDTASAVASLLSAYGGTLADAAKYVDVLALAAKKGNVEVTGMAQALIRLGPVSSRANIPMSQMAATLATLTAKGLTLGEATAGLISVIDNLLNPTAASRDEFQKLGISLVDANGNARDFTSVLAQISQLTNGGAQGLQLLGRGFDQLATTTATMMGQSSDAIASFSTELENANGAAEKLADEGISSLDGRLEEARKKLEDAKVALGEDLAPAMTWFYNNVLLTFIEGLRAAVNWLNNLDRAIAVSWFGAKPDKSFIDQLNDVKRTIRELNAEIEKTKRLGFGVSPETLRRLREAEKQAAALEKIIERQRKREETASPPMQPTHFSPRPLTAPAARATSTHRTPSTRRAETELQKIIAYTQLLQHKLDLGRISTQQYADELAGLFARVDEYSKKVIGNAGEYSHALGVMAAIKKEIAEIKNAASKEVTEAKPVTDVLLEDFTGLDDAIARMNVQTQNEYARALNQHAEFMREMADDAAKYWAHDMEENPIWQSPIPKYLEVGTNWGNAIVAGMKGALRKASAAISAIDVATLDKISQRVQHGIEAMMEYEHTLIGTGESGENLSNTFSSLASNLHVLNMQYELGIVGQGQYAEALNGYLGELEGLLELLPKASDEYARLLELIIKVKGALDNLGGEGGEGESIIPSPDFSDVENELQSIAQSFSSELAQAVRTGDFKKALQNILDGLSQKFLSETIGGLIEGVMAQAAGGIIGSGATSLTAALGPYGLLAGLGLGLISYLIGGTSQPAPPQARTGAQDTSHAPAQVTYHAETNLSIELNGGLNDPKTRSQVEDLAERVTISTLKRLGLIGGANA